MAIDKKLEDQRLARAGYVEVPGGPICGNCEYAKGTRCTHPSVMAEIDLQRGCCNLWAPNAKVKPVSKVWGDGGNNDEPE